MISFLLKCPSLYPKRYFIFPLTPPLPICIQSFPGHEGIPLSIVFPYITPFRHTGMSYCIEQSTSFAPRFRQQRFHEIIVWTFRSIVPSTSAYRNFSNSIYKFPLNYFLPVESALDRCTYSCILLPVHLRTIVRYFSHCICYCYHPLLSLFRRMHP